ncbi:MAG: lipopolysaccharide transport periplasmic protein LptA [Desulfobulbus propionicus]|nr:MAG: lipopolysaccharide transport periplasmic protein LptA [Desulfobulbus propionicus]
MDRLRTFLLRISLTGCTLFLLCTTAFCSDQGTRAPIHIEADRMISQEEKNSVVFMGNVDARQGGVTIRAQEMTVYYAKNKDNSKNDATQVSKLICKKEVEIVQGDWLGTGDRMDYLADERKVILSGHARAWKGQDMITGKTITYYLDEGRSIVEQDPASQGRVKAVLQPSLSN